MWKVNSEDRITQLEDDIKELKFKHESAMMIISALAKISELNVELIGQKIKRRKIFGIF